MIRVTKDWLIKKIEADNLPFWKVYDGKDLIEQNMNISDADKSAQELNCLLDDLDGNVCRVVISNKSNSEKSKGGRDYTNYEYTVKLTGNKGYSENGNMALLKEVFDLKLQLQLNELAKKYEDKPKEQTAFDKAIEEFMPLIQAYMIKQMQPGIAGMHDAEPVAEKFNTENTNRDRLKKVLMALNNADKNYLDLLEAISIVATNKPKIYSQYKPIIINSANE